MITLDMICKTCQHRRCKMETKGKGHVTVWGCGLKGIRFGYQREYDAGVNMPKTCKERVK